MKKLLFIIILFFLSIFSYAQVTYFQAEYASYKIGEAPWTDWESNHDDVIVDLNNEEIIIGRDTYVIFDHRNPQDKKTTINLVFICLLGQEKYYIEFVIFKREKIRHLYIRKDNKQIVYQMIKI